MLHVAEALLGLREQKLVASIGLAIFAVAVAGFVAVLVNDRPAHWLGNQAARALNWFLRLIRQKPVDWDGESWVRFRHRTVGLIKRRGIALTAATLAGQLSVFVVLVVCLRILGVHESQVTLTEAFAAWTFVRLLGSIPITPGGLGIVELGLTGALIGFGGKSADVVAAVLLSRFLTIVPTLILGLIAGATFRHQRREPAAET